MSATATPTRQQVKRERPQGSAARVTPGLLPAATSQLDQAAAVAAKTAGFATVSFWDMKLRDLERNPKAALQPMLARVKDWPPAHLFDAVDQGVPTHVVLLLASAFGDTAASMMNLIGVSETTFRRKEEAGEPLPEVAGHRVMGFLRIVATLQRLLAESGDAEALAGFDLEAWVGAWMRQASPGLAGKTPAQMLRNPEGQRAVEELLERMRGGLPA